MKWILTISVLVVAASVAVAQWPKAVGPPDNAIHHEPMPRKDGLSAAGSDAPVILLEEDEAVGPIATPAKEPNSDDLLYRTSPIGAPAHPDSVHNVAREVRPDRATGREPWLTYHTVFDPAVIPFKRNNVKDKVISSGALVVDNTQLWELPVAGNTISNGREIFLGSILVELRPGFHVPIPSVSPESRILSYVSTPPVKLVFHKDSADNLYVSAKEHSGRLRLKMVMDAPSHWFARPIPKGIRMDQIPIRLRKRLPKILQREARLVRDRLGLGSNGDFGRSLSKLVHWFRSFKAGELPNAPKRSLYLNIALSQKGICRHRAWAFTITAQSLGIPCRYVQNEAHAFVEVWIPESGAF
ncbi:MAG TPA: hypothetical protein EYN66_13570, partial [Myxococcales bacterium]|nr:hypothetical protein [Myxococcales bacterium]